MQLSVALDGSKRRDLTLFQGDSVTLSLTVYQNDGDTTPIAPTNVRFVWPEQPAFSYGTPFTVSDESVGRTFYRLVGEVSGATTTLAYGYITVEGLHGGGIYGCPWVDGYWIQP